MADRKRNRSTLTRKRTFDSGQAGGTGTVSRRATPPFDGGEHGDITHGRLPLNKWFHEGFDARSALYEHGVSGWAILEDGSAEFNDVFLRGEAELAGSVNYIDNPDFETDTSGWRAAESATTWHFDSTTESWTDDGSADTGLWWEPDFTFRAPGGLGVYLSSTDPGAISSPAQVVTEGQEYSALFQVTDNFGNGHVVPRVVWYSDSGATTEISHDDGDTVLAVGDATFWRTASAANLIAPATAIRAKLQLVFVGHNAGDWWFVDEVGFTVPTNATIARDTGFAYSGSASLRIRSNAAGVTLAGTPGTAATGYAVEEGEFFYFRMNYRQANGFSPLIVPAFLDDDGLLVGIDTKNNLFGEPGTSTFDGLYTAVWEVPEGATQLGVIVGFLATAATQDLHIDDVSLTRASKLRGGVWESEDEAGTETQTLTKMTAFLRSSPTGFPYAKFNGLVLHRPILGLRAHKGGVTSVSSGSFTTVPLDYEFFRSGGVTTDSAGYIIAPRTGLYAVFGGFSVADFAFASGSKHVGHIWQDDAGGTFLREVAKQGVHEPNGVAQGIAFQMANICKLSAGDKVYLVYHQASGASINVAAGSARPDGERYLGFVYLGESA